MRPRTNIAVSGTAFLLVILGLLSLLGCSTSSTQNPATNTSTTSITTTTSTTSGVSFSKDIQPIFTNSCVICHQGASGQGGLSLDPGSAYKNLVNAASSESSLMRVAPNSADKSYLLNKLEGTQGQVGGSGAQMPYGAPPLSQPQIDLIQQWISAGAPNN
jgi:hypothetical protein